MTSLTLCYLVMTSTIRLYYLVLSLNILCLLRGFNSLDLDFDLSTTNGIVSLNVYNKRDDFKFKIVNFPFLI